MASPRARAMLHDDTNAGVLTNLEAAGMLRAAYARAGFAGGKVDLLFSDTCLNGMAEVVEELKEFAACVVGSEELEPGDGWEYHEWLGRMSDDPPATPEQWAAQAVDAFGAGYAERPDQYPCTLAACRADNRVASSFAELVEALRRAGPAGFGWVLRARATAQSFTSDKDSCDLKDFATRLGAAASTGEVAEAAAAVAAAVDEAVVRSVALGPTVRRAAGLAFWCPATGGGFEADAETYARLAFDRRTGWSGYLREHLLVA
jgi:Clostripain family